MFTHGADYVLPSLFSRDYSTVMSSVTAFKGVCETAIGTARSLNLPTAPLEAALGLFEEAARRGYGAQDGSANVPMRSHRTVDNFVSYQARRCRWP